MTGFEAVSAALQKIGRLASGDSATTQELIDYLAEGNRMLGTWNSKLGPIFFETLDSLTWTGGLASMTIGTGGALNTTRPLEIIGAQYRDSGNIDYDINIVTHREYQELSTKTLTSTMPVYLAYNPTIASGYGTLFIWPVPAANITLRLNSKKEIAAITSGGTISLPPGWEDAFVNNLSLRLCDFNGTDPTQTLVQAASDSYKAIVESAVDLRTLKLDPMLPGQRGQYSPRAYWNIT